MSRREHPSTRHPRGRSRGVRTLIAAPLLAALGFLGQLAVPAQAAVAQAWQSCDQWGNWQTPDGYILYNNIWGSGAGSQCISAESARNWTVDADHPDTGGIKSYPNAKWIVNEPVGEIDRLSSSYDVTVPSSGAYNTTYDVWDVDHDYEVMLWMNWTGPVGPLGQFRTTVALGGHTWDVYSGNNGSNEVFSFLRHGDSTAGEVDLLAVLRWLSDEGWWGDVTVGDVQFGYEITSAAGGLEFTTNDFDVTSG